MAKSTDLFKFLPAFAVFVYSYFSSPDVIYSAARDRVSSDVTRQPERRETVKLAYDRQVGVKERTGRNDGERVEAYLHYVNLKPGAPWCAAFVCWVFGQTGITNPRSGWSPALFPTGRIIWQRSRLPPALTSQPAKKPQPGDVFGIWFPEKNRIAHTGFVDNWGEKYAVTVEGNTNMAGSREGDGVYRKRRLISSLYQVSGWLEN